MFFIAIFFVSVLFLTTGGPGVKALGIFHRTPTSAAFQTFVSQESRIAAPQGFARVGPAAASSPINLRIALSSSNIAGLEKALIDVSTPSSVNYGKHLTKAQVNAFMAPSDEASTAVQTWLASHGLVANTSSSAGDWLSVSVPISKANEMMSANYETYQHVASGQTYARTLSFSLPTEVADFIDHIHPTTSFTSPRSKSHVVSARHAVSEMSSDATQTSCNHTVTPACLQSLYEIPTTSATQSSSGIAVTGFNKQFAQKADLTSFLKSFRTDMDPNTVFSTQLLDGGSNSQSAGDASGEASLDTQYTVGIATGVPVTFISVGDDGDQDLDIINWLLQEDDAPQVLTTSYGSNEGGLSRQYTSKVCHQYMALGAQGTSILFSSGDAGVEGNRNDDHRACTAFQGSFPSGCPYVTSVGSTGRVSPEVGSSFSSGGFSNYFGIPSYQANAVAGYLKTQGSTNADRFNASGRGYPDVSAQGENFQIISNGARGPIGGTSASTPVFASIIALLNDQLIAAGKPPLGFLNPWLYAHPDMFNDVTAGNNPGCGTDGFAARAGWDPVTGLGTPNFSKMKAAAGL